MDLEIIGETLIWPDITAIIWESISLKFMDIF